MPPSECFSLTDIQRLALPRVGLQLVVVDHSFLLADSVMLGCPYFKLTICIHYLHYSLYLWFLTTMCRLKGNVTLV